MRAPELFCLVILMVSGRWLVSARSTTTTPGFGFDTSAMFGLDSSVLVQCANTSLDISVFSDLTRLGADIPAIIQSVMQGFCSNPQPFLDCLDDRLPHSMSPIDIIVTRMYDLSRLRPYILNTCSRLLDIVADIRSALPCLANNSGIISQCGQYLTEVVGKAISTTGFDAIDEIVKQYCSGIRMTASCQKSALATCSPELADLLDKSLMIMNDDCVNPNVATATATSKPFGDGYMPEPFGSSPVMTCAGDIISDIKRDFSKQGSNDVEPHNFIMTGMRIVCRRLDTYLKCLVPKFRDSQNNMDLLLKEMFNPDRLQEHTVKVCSKLDEMEPNANCFFSTANKTFSCYRKHGEIFSNLGALIGNGVPDFNAVIDKLAEDKTSLCRFVVSMTTCVSDGFRTCNQDIGDMTSHFVMRILTGECGGSGSGSVKLSILLFVAVSLRKLVF